MRSPMSFLPVLAGCVTLLAGCATTGIDGFSAEEAAGFAGCTYAAGPGLHAWSCPENRLVEARVIEGTGLDAAREALYTAHPELSQPEFSRTDPGSLGGRPVKLTMLGYSAQIVWLVTEEDDSCSLVCVFPGSPLDKDRDDAMKGLAWCHDRLEAIQRNLR